MASARKISQTQLAQELGVSQALVSLVLNGRRQGISPETYDRIWEHAVKRGYHPKGMKLTSSPDAGRPRTVGIILRAPLRLSSLGNYFGHIQHGLHSALEQAELSTSFLGAEDELTEAKLGRHFAAGHAFKGLVIFGEVSLAFLQLLRRFERRIVVVSARFPGLAHSVIGNEPQAMEQVVGHLHALGHRRMGWIGGNSDLERHRTRLLAFQNALQQKGLSLDERYCIKLVQADRAEGAEAAHELLPLRKRRDFPTALVCYNSLMAHGATRAFLRAGIKVPGDLSVAGGDPPRTDLKDEPRITGAGSNPERLGATAANLIAASTGDDDEPFHDVLLPSQVTLGTSTGPA